MKCFQFRLARAQQEFNEHLSTKKGGEMSLSRLIRSTCFIWALLLVSGLCSVRDVFGQSSAAQSELEDPGRARFEQFLRSLAIPASQRTTPRESPPATVPTKPPGNTVPTPPRSPFPALPSAGNPRQSSTIPMVPRAAGNSPTAGDTKANSPKGFSQAPIKCTTCGERLVNGMCFGSLSAGVPCPGPLPGSEGNGQDGSTTPLMAGTKTMDSKNATVAAKDKNSGDGTNGLAVSPGGPTNLKQQDQSGLTRQATSSLSNSETTRRGSSAAAQKQSIQSLPGSNDQEKPTSATDATAATESTPNEDTTNQDQQRGSADLMQQLQGINVNAARVAAMANQPFQGVNSPGGDIPFGPQGLNGSLSQIFDAISASAGVGPGLRWKVVRPAGNHPAVEQPAVSLEGSDLNNTGKGPTAKQFNPGVVRSELLSGPKNPLVLPPEIASVVFVVDCSGSMAGGKFERISTAISDAVAQMRTEQRFAVLLFNNVALQVDDGGLLPATDANKMLIDQQMSGVAPVGDTDPTDALLIAIQSKPESIVVFSDGEFDPQIVQTITQLNRGSGLNIRINGVGVGTGVSSLKQLAALNGPGTYFEVP
ncbi:MAG TPA: hypothetical protein DDZ51_14900 [Planctomycetaceae bacterium]|nr:hypothetical protein [Planctomycetaceae bacterium]